MKIDRLSFILLQAAKRTRYIARKNGNCTWLNGGCSMFARAVKKVLGGKIMAICSADEAVNDFPVEHYVISINGLLLDASGAKIEDDFMAAYQKKISRKIYLKSPRNKKVWNGEHWYDKETYQKVIAELKNALDNRY